MDNSPDTCAAITAFLHERRNAIVAGVRRDGRPTLTPNWFLFDGERFYVSTTRGRAKYRLFRRDARVQLLVDDSTGHRYVRVDGVVDIWEDLDRIAPIVRAVRDKHGRAVGDDAALRANLIEEQRVLLVIRPVEPITTWECSGL